MICAAAGVFPFMHELGIKAGANQMNTYYCLKKIRVLTLADVEEIFERNENFEESEPFLIVVPEKWKAFK